MAFGRRQNEFIRVDIDSSATQAAARNLADLMGKTDMLTSIAMTRGVIAGRKAIQAQIFPLIRGGPSPWTRRGLIYSKATPKDLRAQVGFNYGGGKFTDNETTRQKSGIPSGRYMRTNARGGDRPAKSSELQLWRSGTLRKNEDYLVPNKNLPEINKYGNLPGPKWQQAIAGIKGFHAPGSGQNVVNKNSKGNKRQRRRAKAEFFLLQERRVNGESFGYTNRFTGDQEPLAIVRRVGKNRRGFEPVLFVSQVQNYDATFPIQRVAWEAFQKTYGRSFKELVDEAWARKQAKARR